MTHGANVALGGIYAPRVVGVHDRWEIGEWRLKVYGIEIEGSELEDATLRAARAIAESALPSPARNGHRYGVGFAIVHQGRDGRWTLVDWWENESQLFQRTYEAPVAGPPAFEPSAPHLVACTWELGIIEFERNAWIDAVLAPSAANVDKYMEAVFVGAV